MCNLYSITTNQAAIIALFRVMNRYVGNLPPMPGVFPAAGAKRRQRAQIEPIALPPTYSGQRIREITLSKNSRAPSSSAGTGGNGYFLGSGACR